MDKATTEGSLAAHYTSVRMNPFVESELFQCAEVPTIILEDFQARFEDHKDRRPFAAFGWVVQLRMGPNHGGVATFWGPVRWCQVYVIDNHRAFFRAFDLAVSAHLASLSASVAG
jgi:hypothetical protein